MSKKLLTYAAIFLVVSIAGNMVLFSKFKKQKAAKIRMSQNFYNSNDSITRVYNLKLSEIKRVKKIGDDLNLMRIDSLQRENNIKDRHLNSAESILMSYESVKNSFVKPKMDTVYLKSEIIDSMAPIVPKKPILRGNYSYNNGCVFFEADILFDDAKELNVTKSGFHTKVEILDYTKRKKSWLFGLRIGKKENNIIAKSECGAIEITKYKRIR